MLEYYLVPMEERGETPSVRLMNASLLPAGKGVITLYGGEDAKQKGHYTDLWHIRVHLDERHLDYQKIDYRHGDHEHQILSWRRGFTLHYLKSQNDPVMVGGTYGNHQDSQVLMILPEDKCADNEEYKNKQCVPCPHGSIFNKNT